MQRNISHKREWNATICNNTDELGRYYVKWRKSDRERQILYDINYVQNLKNATNQWIKQKRTRLIEIENKLMVTSGKREGGRGNKGTGALKKNPEGYYGIIWNHMCEIFWKL